MSAPLVNLLFIVIKPAPDLSLCVWMTFSLYKESQWTINGGRSWSVIQLQNYCLVSFTMHDYVCRGLVAGDWHTCGVFGCRLAGRSHAHCVVFSRVAVIHKGTSVSRYYRFLAKNGDWVWLQTRATIIYNTKNEPQYVVCMNYVIGWVHRGLPRYRI